MKIWAFVASIALSVAVSTVSVKAEIYHAPAHNYYQNNWMSHGG
jgi:hypothetical protein